MQPVLLAGALWCVSCLLCAQVVRPALEGLDPVRLTEGEESPGDPKITAEHAGFRYQFVSGESLSKFQKEPARYSIQLGGACARMGAPVSGNPDAYYVHDHRIYVFGSQACYKLFAANPARYLEKEPEPWKPDSEARERGRALLDKAAASIGDLASIRAYRETRARGGATVTRSIDLKAGRYRSDTVNANLEFGDLSLPSGAYNIFRGQMRRSAEQFDGNARRPYEREALVLLAARGASGFDAYSDGGNMVTVRWNGAVTRLELDPVKGSVMAIEYNGRGSAGAVGKIRIAFSEHRKSGNWTVPHRAQVSLDGQPEAALSWETTELVWNPTDLDGKFQVKEPQSAN